MNNKKDKYCSKCKCEKCLNTLICEGGCANCGIQNINPRKEIDSVCKHFEGED